MTDAAQAADAAPKAISTAQGAQMLAEQRAANQGKTELSAHASAMGKAGAAARQARTTQAQPEPEPVTEGETEQDDEALGNEGETLNDETASNGQSEETEADDKANPDEGMIDLGDGVTISKDLVREGIMLKADHTRKTQALSAREKEFEAIRTQKVAQLDQSLLAVQSLLPQPKDQDALIDELGLEAGIRAFAQQHRMWAQFGNLSEQRNAMQAEYLGQQKQTTIKALSEKHGDKAESLFSQAVQYVASKTGTETRNVEAMLSHPEAVELVKDAMAYRELKAKEPAITRTIAEKPKVVRPGPKHSAQAAAQSATQNARAKLKASGSLADAVAYLQAQRTARG